PAIGGERSGADAAALGGAARQEIEAGVERCIGEIGERGGRLRRGPGAAGFRDGGEQRHPALADAQDRCQRRFFGHGLARAADRRQLRRERSLRIAREDAGKPIGMQLRQLEKIGRRGQQRPQRRRGAADRHPLLRQARQPGIDGSVGDCGQRVERDGHPCRIAGWRGGDKAGPEGRQLRVNRAACPIDKICRLIFVSRALWWREIQIDFAETNMRRGALFIAALACLAAGSAQAAPGRLTGMGANLYGNSFFHFGTPNLKSFAVSSVTLGKVRISLQRTRLEEVQRVYGGTIYEEGGGMNLARWLCYQGPQATTWL